MEKLAQLCVQQSDGRLSRDQLLTSDSPRPSKIGEGPPWTPRAAWAEGTSTGAARQDRKKREIGTNTGSVTSPGANFIELPFLFNPPTDRPFETIQNFHFQKCPLVLYTHGDTIWTVLVASCTIIQIHSNGFRGSIDSPLRSIQTRLCISCTTIWKDPNKVLYLADLSFKTIWGINTVHSYFTIQNHNNGFKWCINLYEKGTKSRRVNRALYFIQSLEPRGILRAVEPSMMVKSQLSKAVRWRLFREPDTRNWKSLDTWLNNFV